MAVFRAFSQLKFLFIGLLIGAIGFWVINTYYISKNLSGVEELFKEDIEYRFYKYATKISEKQRLQVATLQQVEIFERTSHLKALGLALPDVVVKATVPVEYSFFVSLNQGWKFTNTATEIIVDVPGLTNSTPAADVSKVRYDIVKGSLLRSENKSLRIIQKELMGLLVEKSIEHRSLVKEQARASVEKFVREWLVEATGENATKTIRIRFPDDSDRLENTVK